jgi:hypothetical protein
MSVADNPPASVVPLAESFMRPRLRLGFADRQHLIAGYVSENLDRAAGPFYFDVFNLLSLPDPEVDSTMTG